MGAPSQLLRQEVSLAACENQAAEPELVGDRRPVRCRPRRTARQPPRADWTREQTMARRRPDRAHGDWVDGTRRYLRDGSLVVVSCIGATLLQQQFSM